MKIARYPQARVNAGAFGQLASQEQAIGDAKANLEVEKGRTVQKAAGAASQFSFKLFEAQSEAGAINILSEVADERLAIDQIADPNERADATSQFTEKLRSVRVPHNDINTQLQSRLEDVGRKAITSSIDYTKDWQMAEVKSFLLTADRKYAELKDFDSQKSIWESPTAKLSFTPLQIDSQLRAIETERNISGAQDKVDQHKELLYQDPDAAEKFARELSRDKSIDREIRDKAVSGISSNMTEFTRFSIERRKAEESQGMQNAFDNEFLASRRQITSQQNEQAFKSGAYGDAKSVGARRRKLQVESEIIKQNDFQIEEADFAAAMSEGRPLDPNMGAKEKAAYDRFVVALPSMEQQIAAVASANVVPNSWTSMFRVNGQRAEDIVKALPLYRELLDRAPTINTGLTGDFASVYAVANENSKYMAENVAAESAIKQVMEVDDAEVSRRKDFISKENVEMGDIFDPSVFVMVADAPARANQEWRAAYDAIYISTGNDVVARNMADKAVKENWKVNDLNGGNAVMKWGPQGDVRKDYFKQIQKQLRDAEIVFMQDGLSVSKSLTPIEIRNDIEIGAPTVKDGPLQLLYEGFPITALRDGEWVKGTFTYDPEPAKREVREEFGSLSDKTRKQAVKAAVQAEKAVITRGGSGRGEVVQQGLRQLAKDLREKSDRLDTASEGDRRESVSPATGPTVQPGIF